ncbi:hypothetical protein [Dongshaea marina]|uniref:hypothetical protein n=1 Tax=Dongshaea marina TaxID=2047966 RepID=UPI00131EF44A|nr:hypothetical protein [Dongshaea marina]
MHWRWLGLLLLTGCGSVLADDGSGLSEALIELLYSIKFLSGIVLLLLTLLLIQIHR